MARICGTCQNTGKVMRHNWKTGVQDERKCWACYEDSALPQEGPETIKLIREMKAALESCYNVVDWPANGQTRQDAMIKKADQWLTNADANLSQTFRVFEYIWNIVSRYPTGQTIEERQVDLNRVAEKVQDYMRQYTELREAMGAARSLPAAGQKVYPEIKVDTCLRWPKCGCPHEAECINGELSSVQGGA